MAATHPPIDATQFLESLDVTQLRERLDAMDRERAALLVLLRAARARERRTQAAAEVLDGD
jgi:hypothetical protein